MKKILAALIAFGRNVVRPRDAGFHNDSLRANQGQNGSAPFSFWRALVS